MSHLRNMRIMDGTSTDLAQVSTTGDVHIRLQNFGSSVSSNSNTQLNITNFNSTGGQLFNNSTNAGFVQISDGSSRIATVNSERRLDIVQHAHVDSGAIHYHHDFSSTGTHRIILIDISDTTNYPHTLTDYAHLEWFEIQVDADINGDYVVTLGFLENVGSSDGDFYVAKHWSGTKSVGNQLIETFSPYPNGWRMRSENLASHRVDIDSTSYNTTQDKLPTVFDNSSEFSGSGDIVLEVLLNNGNISLAFDGGYHSH